MDHNNTFCDINLLFVSDDIDEDMAVLNDMNVEVGEGDISDALAALQKYT